VSRTIDFQTDPSRYRHWRVEYNDALATVTMDVDEQGGLFDGYELKLNSYDLGVDIELADIVQRMRFEHPEVRVVVMQSGNDKVFCAGANIRMLSGATHAHKVNFCKFTNETRNTYEAAAEQSQQHYIASVRGSCAGGGYELALACNEIYLVDDGSTTVSLPEIPLLAVLPGTGGLTRVTDKRHVRRDIADVFCSLEEGVKGQRAVQWGLVDAIVPKSGFDDFIAERTQALIASSTSTLGVNNIQEVSGITLGPLTKQIDENGSLQYSLVQVTIDRDRCSATICLNSPDTDNPTSVTELHQQTDQSWLLRLSRELDDAVLHLRLNELDIGVWLFRSAGDAALVAEHERFLLAQQANDWLSREILLAWGRVLKRIDLSARSLVGLVEIGSCYTGLLTELLFAVDRSYMMEDEFEDMDMPPATLHLSDVNFGQFPMANNLSRLHTRFLDNDNAIQAARAAINQPLDAEQAMALGLVTFAYDDIDWFDEIRVFLEERASFSPDAMTGMEANLRFPGPETMETKIFGRLTAWQNWIFQRPNAVGESGALQRYGTGTRADFDKRRV